MCPAAHPTVVATCLQDWWVQGNVGTQKNRRREGQAVEALPGLEVPEGFALESLSDSLQTGDLTAIEALLGLEDPEGCDLESPSDSQPAAELPVNPLQVGAGAAECAPSPEALTCTRSSDNSNTGADNPLPAREEAQLKHLSKHA
ncbi:g7794 [Coccomyxa viridis]|uniref:G7794 protein n=1 Tax=Coccomyxa viridis TaxID=1274662 RepID=A0ABP1FYR7_9CHLO